MSVYNFITVIAVLTVACACARDRGVKGSGNVKYELKVNDEPEKFRFSLVLTSKDNRDLCIERVSWPDSKGKTQTGSYVYSLRTERGTIFPHAATIEADCWGTGCMTKIRPGASLQGFIAYSEFGEPTGIRSLHKRELRVDIVPSLCEKKAVRHE